MSEKVDSMSDSTRLVDERWLENQAFLIQRRIANIVISGVVLFTLTLSLLGFVATGDSMSFLAAAVVIPAVLVGYTTGLFLVPQSVRLSDDGFQLRYWGPQSGKTLLWKQIGTILFERRQPGILKKREAYTLTFRDKRRKRMLISPTLVSQDIFKALRNTSRKESPNIEWRER